MGLWLIGVLLALAGCGGGGGETTTTTETLPTTETTTTETTPSETTKLRVYFLLNGKVQPVARDVPKTQAVLSAALEQLVHGPTTSEREYGLTNEAGPGCAATSATVAEGTATLALAGGCGRLGLAQAVYTATQFPTVKRVELGGKRYTRADFEDETPIILVESPLPFEKVGNPLRARGTANTFEATFQYEVVEPEGRIVASNFTTATSGSGQRGTFDFTTDTYEVSRPGLGSFVVFELSAKDGSRIHLVEIPVEMVK